MSIFRIYAQYEPLRVFWSLALLIGLASVGVWVRFAVSYAEGNGKGHVQSLILGAVLFIAAVVLWALGVIGDLLAAQRVMTQKTFERVRRIELALGVAPSHYERGAAEPAPAEPPARRQRRRTPSARAGGAPVSGVTVSEDGVVTGNTYDKYGSTNPRRAPADGRPSSARSTS